MLNLTFFNDPITKAKMLTCHDHHCYYDNVFDELYLQPENIKEHSTRKTNKVLADENNLTYYVLRSGHREVTPEDNRWKRNFTELKDCPKPFKDFD